MCIDYRKLNCLVLKDRFPVPIVENVLEKMQSAKFFMVMDLKNGFFHVPVEENSKKYTAFITKQGVFEFNKAPFGFCNSPAVFVRFLNIIFQGLRNEGIMELYVDDIVVFGQTAEACLAIVQRVLQRAQLYGLEIKWSKCQFLQNRINFLGHTIQDGKVWPGHEKLKAVKNFPTPNNLRSVQAFLGLAGYFRKFVQDYALIAKPLTQLLKKDTEFKIAHEELAAVAMLKAILIEEPVLKIFKQTAKTQLHVDASKSGFGGVLLQLQDGKWHPVYYWSRKTTPHEEKLHSYVLEVKAAYLATKRLRHYLLGIEFVLVTDCSAFKQTTTKKDVPREVAQWLMYLQDFNFKTEHRTGNRMKHVDSLSRYPVFVVTSEIRARIVKAQQSDEHLKAVAEILKEKAYGNFVIKDELIYKQLSGRDVLAVPKRMEKEIIDKAHGVGHMGVQKTMHAIEQDYFIPHLEHKVRQHIANCIECILHNRKMGKQDDFLHIINKGDAPLCTIHIDHLGPLDTTAKCYKYIFALVDGFTKFTWLFATKSTDAEDAVKHLTTWVDIFGSPQRIISDKGPAFTSKLFKEFCAARNVEHVETTTGVPRGNGQIERVNRVILSVLAKLSATEPSKWYKYIGQVQRAINAHVHSATKYTPFEVLFGVKIRSETRPDVVRAIEEEILTVFADERKKVRMEAKEAIQKAQAVYKKNFDKRRKPHTGYQKFDLVAIRQTQFVAGKKLSSKFIGPYKIVEVKQNGRYKVEKAADFEGPGQTSTSADNMKLWKYIEDAQVLSSGSDDDQDDRV